MLIIVNQILLIIVNQIQYLIYCRLFSILFANLDLFLPQPPRCSALCALLWFMDREQVSVFDFQIPDGLDGWMFGWLGWLAGWLVGFVRLSRLLVKSPVSAYKYERTLIFLRLCPYNCYRVPCFVE